MKKFLAIVKHEYKKIVYKWTFVLGTLLFPVIGACFSIVPAIIFSMKGEAIRLIVVDPTAKIAPRLKENLSAENAAYANAASKPASIDDVTMSQDERMKQRAVLRGPPLFIRAGPPRT